MSRMARVAAVTLLNWSTALAGASGQDVPLNQDVPLRL